MTLKAMINTIKIYDEGTDISYGRMFRTSAPTRIGVIPYGYADGFFRCLSNRCSIMTSYGPAPQRGRICMDMSMIDLSKLPDVGVGDEVEIFGPHNPVETLARPVPYPTSSSAPSASASRACISKTASRSTANSSSVFRGARTQLRIPEYKKSHG